MTTYILRSLKSRATRKVACRSLEELTRELNKVRVETLDVTWSVDRVLA